MRQSLLGSIAALFVTGIALGHQASSSGIVGTVRDGTGAPIPLAELKIRNTNTNDMRESATDDNGEFTIANLAPGVYDVSVVKSGFRMLRETGLELQVDQTARLELKLEVGSISESIEVKASVPLLNTENAVKGDVIVSSEIVEMPLNGRDFGDLAFLVPGVMRRAQGGQGSAFAVNGARADNTNFVVDGFNNQNPRGGAAQARPNLDAMQEFKMQTSNYSAEFGRLAGGVMNMVLKTGGNDLHGVLFEFVRNDVFDARNFFDTRRSKLRRNQFGGTASGPVWIPKIYDGRDKTFWLFSWESYRQIFGQNRLGIVPTPAEMQGNFSASGPLRDPLATGTCSAANRASCFPDNRIPASRLNPIALKAAAFYPLPNRPGLTNNFQANVPDTDSWNAFVLKFDHRFSSSDSVSFRYLKRYNVTTNPFNGSDLGIFGSRVRSNQSLMGLNHTHLFRNNLINEARIGFSRTANRERGYNQGRDYAAEFGLPDTTTDPNLIGFPRFTILNFMTLGDGNNMPVEFTVNNVQFGDTLTWVKGRHLVKFGGDVLRTQFFQPYLNNNRGTFNFLGRWTSNSFADFLLGMPESTSRQVGTTPNYLFSTNYGFFAQDDWKIAPTLTLNLGARYELMLPPTEKFGRYTNFIPELGKLILADDATIRGTGIAFSDPTKIGVARDYDLPRSLVYPNLRMISPRIGFAWRPFGGNRTVVRSGYGMFYGNQVQNPVRNDLSNVFPFAITQTFNRQAANPNFLTLNNPFPAPPNLTGNIVNVNGYEYRPRAPYLQSWNFTIEREIGRGSGIEIAYVGSKGTHLGRRYDINQPFRSPEQNALTPGVFPRPISAFAVINFYGFSSNSNYNSAVVTFRRRFASGFFYRVNYVFSKSIDDASQLTGNSDGGVPGAQDARNLRGERARSDWDNGHAVTMNFSYAVPGSRHFLIRGWQVTGTGRAYTGQPLSPRVNNVNLNLGDANRPDRLSKGTASNPTVERWFDVAAFPRVPTGSFRFGNAGRNILDGPGLLDMNMSLFKNFAIRETVRMQFRWEVFNAMNHANLSLPNVFVDAPNGGTITDANAGRSMQLGLRLWF